MARNAVETKSVPVASKSSSDANVSQSTSKLSDEYLDFVQSQALNNQIVDEHRLPVILLVEILKELRKRNR